MSFIKLKIEGIDAEGEDSTLAVRSLEHIVSMPMNETNVTSSSAGMRTSGAAKHGQFCLGVNTSIAIPKLMEALHTGKELTGVTITASRMNNDVMEPYMVYMLENVFVSKIQADSEVEGGNLNVAFKISLDYTGLKINVTSFDDTGAAKGTVEASLTRRK